MKLPFKKISLKKISFSRRRLKKLKPGVSRLKKKLCAAAQTVKHGSIVVAKNFKWKNIKRQARKLRWRYVKRRAARVRRQMTWANFKRGARQLSWRNIKNLHLGHRLNSKLPRAWRFTVLDRYIIRKFLGTFAFSLILLLAIVIMFDINEKLDAFLKAPLNATVFQYFLNFIPYFANQFAPLFTFIAVIFFTSKLAGNSEIIAMLSTGMSFKRLLRPYMVSALVIAIATFILSAYIIPPANVKRINYTNTYVKNRRVDYGSNIMLMASPGEIAYMSRYDNLTKTGVKFSLDKFDKDKKIVTRLTAQSIRWDTLYNWQLHDYVIRDFKGNREYVRRGRSLDTILPFEPRDYLISKGDWEMMSTPALAKYVERQKERGVANIQQFELEYHRRFAMTAAAFILTVIGMALSSRKVKGGMGLNLGIGLVLSFGYILFMTITQAFAVSGLTSPMIAMWIPNLVFSIIAIVLYMRARR